MLLSFLVSMAIGATDPMKDPCRDDHMRDRCSAAEQDRMRKLYRVEPIKAFAAGTSRRVFYVDGYGNDVVAIEFMRMPERDPTLRVHFPKVPGEKPIPPLQTMLTAEQWQTIIDASENFDRSFAPRKLTKAETDDDDIVICLHSWVYWAEATDSGKAPRSVTEDSCNDAPVEQYAWAAVKLARSAFAHCRALDPQFSRNDATLLRSCEGLFGDRLAAAEVFNRGESLRRIDSPDSDGGINRFSDYELTVDYNGDVKKGPAAEALWKSIFAAKNRPNFYYDWIKGLDADTVIVTGGRYLSGDDESKDQTAAVEMRWEKETDRFDLTAIKISPYRPYKRVSE